MARRARSDGMSSYVLAGDDEDLRRLMGVSEILHPFLRAGLNRSGVRSGWSVLDVGCGPGGALPVLSEAVGADGRIVGIDRQTEALATAGRLMRALGVENVKLVEGDAAHLDPVIVGGPFDLILTRMFMMHQPDPDRMLAALWHLLRPGGILLCQEPMDEPAPRAWPAAPVLGEYWALFHRLLYKSGIPAGLVASLPGRGRKAGFEVAHTEGYYLVAEPSLASLHVATLVSAKPRMLASGVATEERIDRLVDEMRAVATGEFDWVTSGVFLEVALRRPEE